MCACFLTFCLDQLNVDDVVVTGGVGGDAVPVVDWVLGSTGLFTRIHRPEINTQLSGRRAPKL